MNKDSEINKEEPLLENVSFVSSSKEDQRASIDISKRWITLIPCLLLLSTIVGCVGLTIGKGCLGVTILKLFYTVQRGGGKGSEWGQTHVQRMKCIFITF